MKFEEPQKNFQNLTEIMLLKWKGENKVLQT